MNYTDMKENKILSWFQALRLNLLRAPISIVLLVTDRCGCKCKMCTHWQMKEFYDLDYETFHSIMKACQDNGTESVFLSGGDCFFWKHWSQFLNDKSLTIPVQITTPLIIPEDFQFQQLKRLKWIRISFDAIREETYKKIRRTGNFLKILEDIEDIVDGELIEDIGFTTCLQKDNISELAEMGEWISSLGVKRWIVQPIQYNPDIQVSEIDIVEMGKFLNHEFGKSIPINNFNVLMENYETFKKTENIPCYIPRMLAFIDTRLRVWPCCNIAQDSRGDEPRIEMFKMGQLLHGPLAGEQFLEFWKLNRNYLDKYPDFKKIHPLCEYTCKFKYFYYNLAYHKCLQSREVIYI